MISTSLVRRIRVISGGQTGIDRAALDAAMSLHLPVGGWCPRGRLAEDGSIPAHYCLQETPSTDYAQRTEWNVRDSEATLVLYQGVLEGGTALTTRLARHYRRPLKLVDLASPVPPLETRLWIATCEIAVLNVAGPRESQAPGIGANGFTYLEHVLEVPE